MIGQIVIAINLYFKDSSGYWTVDKMCRVIQGAKSDAAIIQLEFRSDGWHVIFESNFDQCKANPNFSSFNTSRKLTASGKHFCLMFHLHPMPLDCMITQIYPIVLS